MSTFNYIFPKRKNRNINRYSKILVTASFLPEKTISNDEIIHCYSLPFKNTAIIKTIGVEHRHVADNHATDSDLLYEATQRCLEKHKLPVEKLSRLIVNKYFGDNLIPMTASMLQRKLGSSVAMQAFDIDGGVSSFLYSVDVASRFIDTGDDYILIASGGINYRLISKSDPRVAFLFGDASSAILLGHSKEPHILASYFYSNYEYYEHATSISPLTLVDREEYLLGEDGGSKLFDTYRLENWKIAEDFYRAATQTVSSNLLEESGLCMDDIDLVLVTENNRKIWELTLEVLGIGEDRSLSLIRNVGNTMSAMLPLLLDQAFATGKLEKGMNIMLISHGEGMSGGGMIYKI